MTILEELFDSVWGQCSSPAEGAIDFAMLTARLEAVPFQSRVTDLRLVGRIFQEQIPPVGRNDNFWGSPLLR